MNTEYNKVLNKILKSTLLYIKTEDLTHKENVDKLISEALELKKTKAYYGRPKKSNS
jgi:hypothetical protein